MVDFPFQGDSGQHYDYSQASQADIKSFPRQGGNYIFAKSRDGSPRIIYVAEVASIRNGIASSKEWEVAQAVHGADLIYIRLQPDQQSRRDEVTDLVKLHRPPMNVVR